MNQTDRLRLKIRQRISIKRLHNVFCKLKPSNIHGVGIFAIKDIPKGINPFLDSYLGQNGTVLDKNQLEYNNLGEEYKQMLEDHYPTLGDRYQYISDYPNQLIWTNYINYVYDDKANLELLQNGEWVTKRLIKKGEELLENPNELFNSDGSHKIYKVKNGLYRTIS